MNFFKFHLILNSEELTYNTKTGNCLQMYELCFDSLRSHSTKLFGENRHNTKYFLQIGSAVKRYKL